MKKLFYILLIIIMLSIGTVAGLHFTGYLFNKQPIIPPNSYIEWNDTSIKSNITVTKHPILLNLTEKMKEIPGIQYIQFKIFISNNSITQNIAYYTDILENKGYSYQDDYSGLTIYENEEIYYHTFTKGLNAVVIYLSNFNQQTWICYSTSDLIHYQQIYEYMITHNILS